MLVFCHQGSVDKMRLRQKPSLFQSSLVAAVSFAMVPLGSALLADETLPTEQIAGAWENHEIASLPKLPARAAQSPTKPNESRRPPTTDLRDSVVLNSRSFGIPFNVDQAGSRPVEVHLFVSRGENSEWKLLDRKPPSVKEFQFKGTDDGPYWFATRTVDAQGNAQPGSHLKPQLRVFIDTTQPELTLNVEADASGRVDAAFVYADRTPIKSVQLHYATDVLREWTKLDVRDAVAGGKIHFQPKENWQQLSLQIIATDAANNRTVTSKLIQRPRIASGTARDFSSIESYQSNRDDDAIQLVAGDANGATSNIFVHRAEQRNRTSSVNNQPVNTNDLKAEKSQSRPVASLPEAEIAQAPTAVNPNQRFSPQPTANSFFRPNDPSSTQPNTSQPYDPRQLDPRSLNLPGTQTNQYGSQLAPTKPSFGPPSVTENRKQYQLVRPTPQQAPAPQRTAPPQTLTPQQAFAPGPNTLDPNAPPIPRGMTFPKTFAKPSAQRPPASPQYPPASAQFPPASAKRPPASRPITLPPASTPDQISNGFGGLNMPNGQSTFTGTTPSHSQPPAELSIDREVEKAQASRTPEEAMRPLEKDSYNRDRDAAAQQESPNKQPADVDSPAYRAMRQSQAAYDHALLADRAVVRYSDSERFSLEYELEAIGAGGAESVELYGSTNAGQTWKRWGNDPDLVSPFDIETKGEGTFAFKIVVISRNGLASPRPLPAETPDIVVIVDKSKPVVKITDVKYGEGERTGSLVIRYDCQDTNLMQRPIALSFSDSPSGPWTTIAAGLRNEGDYVWPGDPELPRQIYLRIDAKDRAGNAGSYLLAEPIESQGLAPRARIRGFRSLGAHGFDAPGEHTANLPQAAFK